MAFNLVLSETQEALLKQVMSLCGLTSKKDAVENAITLLGWAAMESAKGYSIASVDDERKQYREITTPALQNARMKAQLAKEKAERAKQPAHA
jgi:Arc/MetJ family transcription regulator